MKVVTPATIDTDRLISSNVTETILDYDATKTYIAGDFCVYGQKLYQAAVGLDVASIPDFNNTDPYIVGNKVKIKADNKIYIATAGGISSDFVDWNKDKVYYKGQYCKQTSCGKIYLAKGGEDPSQHEDWVATTTYAIEATVKVVPSYDIKNGNVSNQIRVYKSRKDGNLNKFPPSNLTGSTPFWELVGICNTNSPPDTSVLYDEWLEKNADGTAKVYPVGSVVKVTAAGAAFIALKENNGASPELNLVGSDPKWKRLEPFDVNRTNENYLWEAYDVLNIGINPTEDVKLTEPKAWKEFGIYNIGFQPNTNIYVAATSDTEAVGAWYDLGYTNKWRMFDNSVSTVTVQSELIEVVLDWTWCDTVALFNLNALYVEIELKVGDTVLHSERLSTFVDDYTSWSDVFFSDPQFVGNVYKVLPPSFGAKLKVKIVALSGTAQCGHLVIGKGKHIGMTQYGVKSGIADYSKVVTDEYGDTSLSQGKYAVTADIDLWLNKGMRPAVRRFLEERRATPLVWHMDNEDNSPSYDLVLFGKYDEFTTVIEGFELDGCSISITGLA